MADVNVGLLALGLASLMGLMVIIFFPGARAAMGQMLRGTVLTLLAITVIATLMIAVTDYDIEPLLRRMALIQTDNKMVDFYALLPDEYRVQSVECLDVDGDGQEEWVVFYQFDLADGRSPYAGAIYDFDRGTPPILFPYQLLPPDRDYLSDGTVHFARQEIVILGETEANPIYELLVYGDAGDINTDLTIFRYIPNTFPWEEPRDDPRLYRPIGVFRGDGGVLYDPITKHVITTNRVYDRSQLAVETVHALDEARGTYMSLSNPKVLAPPVSQKVAFSFGMPDDILDTPYPEKIVLGFYESLGQPQSQSHPPAREFLTGAALIEYDRDNLDFFGFAGVVGKLPDISEVKVTELQYAPQVEEFAPSVTAQGQEPRFLIVSVAFSALVHGTPVSAEGVNWVTTMVNGKWRIDRHTHQE